MLYASKIKNLNELDYFMRICTPKQTQKEIENVSRLQIIVEFKMVVRKLYQKALNLYCFMSRSFKLKSDKTYTYIEKKTNNQSCFGLWI